MLSRKHDLTPQNFNSKKKFKSTSTEEDPEEPDEEFASPLDNLSPFDNHSVKIQQLMQQQSTRLTSRQVQERNQRHDRLKENLVESPGREVAQSDVLQLLQITESKECKELASGAIGRTFGPGVQFSRRKKVYQNIRKRISYSVPIGCEYSVTYSLTRDQE